MLKIIGAAVVLALVLAGAAYTKPSREDLHGAATQYADNSSFVGSVATRVTGVFGNDTYDDYIFFDRYRVYVGKEPKIDCFGAFGKTSCSLRQPEKTAEEQ
ncbi:MAG TPA: hypothetical protein VFV07_10545 [Rhizomicrobium sp.]|nr:hypothetical protein [Rhizomicrobium sp.]